MSCPLRGDRSLRGLPATLRLLDRLFCSTLLVPQLRSRGGGQSQGANAMRVARCPRQGRYACGSAWYTYGTGRAVASLPYGALTVSLAWLSPSPRSVPVPGLSVRRPPGPIRVSVRAKPSHASPGTLVPWPRTNRGGRLVSPSKRRPSRPATGSS
jgi:hypothetical protein